MAQLLMCFRQITVLRYETHFNEPGCFYHVNNVSYRTLVFVWQTCTHMAMLNSLFTRKWCSSMVFSRSKCSLDNGAQLAIQGGVQQKKGDHLISMFTKQLIIQHKYLLGKVLTRHWCSPDNSIHLTNVLTWKWCSPDNSVHLTNALTW